MMKNKLLSLPILLFAALAVSSYLIKDPSLKKTGTVKISFINTVKGKSLELHTGIYINPSGEPYTVSKFKYYISNVSLTYATGNIKEEESYHLVDESKSESLNFHFNAAGKNYLSVSFMLGVDSIRNVSGAQTGSLDPLNDMFWTWNSGYIMAKMEGSSPLSKVVNHKVEFHIGGFSGPNNVLKNITLNLPAGMLLNVKEGGISEIFIEADLDTWWHGGDDITIAAHPVCTTPGALAKQFADNYCKMFSIKKIVNN